MSNAAAALGAAHPRMVALVREAKGWSQVDLAQASGLSQGYVSKVESGLLELRGERLDAVAGALDCPADLLVDDLPVRGLEVTCLHHRRRVTKVTVASRKKIEAVTHLSRVTIQGILSNVDLEAELALVRLDIDEVGSPAEAAQQLRALWCLPSGPVPNLIATLERAGILIHVRALGTAGQDALSSWPIGGVPIMLLNSGLAVDRKRFTLAHELGHLVMHTLPSETQEIEANQFAAEFLAPADDIADELAGLTTRDFPRLLEMKSKWRISVGALIQRAKDIGAISDRQFREFQIRLNALGWKTVEPDTLANEEPALLDAIIEAKVAGEDASVAGLARDAHMTEAAFRRHYLRASNGGGSVNRIHVKVVRVNE